MLGDGGDALRKEEAHREIAKGRHFEGYRVAHRDRAGRDGNGRRAPRHSSRRAQGRTMALADAIDLARQQARLQS